MYKVVYYSSGYEEILSPSGEYVAGLSEPEDRTCNRDVAPLIDELNRLHLALMESEQHYENLRRENNL